MAFLNEPLFQKEEHASQLSLPRRLRVRHEPGQTKRNSLNETISDINPAKDRLGNYSVPFPSESVTGDI